MVESINILECAPRDGMAAISKKVSISEKIQFVDMLSDVGLKSIDCVSFHHPRLNPEHAYAEEIMEGIQKKRNVIYIGLVPDEIGCRRAMETAVDGVVTLISVSEEFNQKFLGQPVKERLHKTIPAIFETARTKGKHMCVYMQTAFGCPFTGNILQRQVIEMVESLAFLGAKRISFVDNPGMATPKQVKALMGEILRLDLDIEYGVHFHDMRGVALANCVAAYEAGIRSFDTAVGGLSLCWLAAPYTQIGLANIPTEDLIYLFEAMGISTGIDMDSLLRSVEFAEKMVGHSLPGHMLRLKKPSSISGLTRGR